MVYKCNLISVDQVVWRYDTLVAIREWCTAHGGKMELHNVINHASKAQCVKLVGCELSCTEQVCNGLFYTVANELFYFGGCELVDVKKPCDGCKFAKRVRTTKCSCCKRNAKLKDCYEVDKNEQGKST